MRAISIDDIPMMHQVLKTQLEEIDSEVEIIATAATVEEGIAVIEAEQPDLLFLDIDLPDGTGFDLLSRIDAGKYLVIFISSHSEYGRMALDFEALAYLDKPLQADELEVAIERAQRRFTLRSYEERVADMSRATTNFREKKLPSRIIVANTEKEHILQVTDIIFFKGQTGLTTIYIEDAAAVSKSISMTEYVKKFEKFPQFMKVKRGYLVNLYHITGIARGTILEMSNGHEIPVSTETIKEIKDRLGRL